MFYLESAYIVFSDGLKFEDSSLELDLLCISYYFILNRDPDFDLASSNHHHDHHSSITFHNQLVP